MASALPLAPRRPVPTVTSSAGLARRLLGQPDPRDLGERVDAARHQRAVEHAGPVEGRLDGVGALGLAEVGELGARDGVADRVDVARRRCAGGRRRRSGRARCGCRAPRGRRRPCSAPAPPRPARGRPRARSRPTAARRAPSGRYSSTSATVVPVEDLDALAPQGLGHRLAHAALLAGQDRRQRLHQRHAAAERRHHRGELAPDDAAAHDRSCSRAAPPSPGRWWR